MGDRLLEVVESFLRPWLFFSPNFDCIYLYHACSWVLNLESCSDTICTYIF
jgi:hypothetical protein